jgi:hypothetical protein
MIDAQFAISDRDVADRGQRNTLPSRPANDQLIRFEEHLGFVDRCTSPYATSGFESHEWLSLE